MSIDLILHAGTKFALHQWLDARDLGDNVQDTDPESPTFGEYQYTHRVGTFLWWNHPSGVVTKSIDNTDPENPVVTNFAGFFALLRLDEIPENGEPELDEEGNPIPQKTKLRNWVETSTAVSVLDGVAGVGGEGVTILDPEDLRATVQAGGAPLWGGVLGVANNWSDPRLWAFSNVMTGDQREFGGVTYESLIDFNVWSPTQYPQGWAEVVQPDPPATPEWATGVAYAVGDEVTYRGATYRCLQAHTSLAGWTPAAVPALWQAV